MAGATVSAEKSRETDATTVPAHRAHDIPEVPPGARVAGIVLVLVGLANVGFGVLALATGLVRLAPPDAGMLLVLGVATVALGVLILRRRTWATTVALFVFGALFVAQAVRAATAEDGAGSIPALLTLALVVVPLLVARRQRATPDADIPND